MLKTEKQSWFSRNLGNRVPVKLLAGLAVGAMLMTTIGMPGSGVSADEPSRPLGLGYYFELDVADGTGSIISAKVESMGFGPLADIPTSNTKVERQGFGSIDDWAKVEIQGYGSLADIAAPRKAKFQGYGSLTDVPTLPRVDARSFGRQITGLDPMDKVMLDAMNERGSSKATTWDPTVYSGGLDVLTENTQAPFRASFGYHGFGPLDDVTSTAKVERQGFGPLDDYSTPARVKFYGYGPLMDWAGIVKIENQGFGSLADVVTPAKVEFQGFGAIDDWANSGKVTHRGFGSLDDMGAVQR